MEADLCLKLSEIYPDVDSLWSLKKPDCPVESCYLWVLFVYRINLEYITVSRETKHKMLQNH